MAEDTKEVFTGNVEDVIDQLPEYMRDPARALLLAMLEHREKESDEEILGAFIVIMTDRGPKFAIVPCPTPDFEALTSFMKYATTAVKPMATMMRVVRDVMAETLGDEEADEEEAPN